MPEDIFQIQSCASFDEQPDDLVMSKSGGRVQRCGVGMAADRVIAVGILACVEQQANDFDVTELRCVGERQVAILGASARK